MPRPSASDRLARLALAVAAAAVLAACAGTVQSPRATEATPSLSPSVAGSAAGPSAPEPPATLSESATPSPSATAGAEQTLGELLALLATAPEQRTGYDRDLFRHWVDADGDGCNTRREVLIVEAVVAPEVGGGCSLTGGSWVSLYDGLAFTDPAGMDIDHVVALGEAWDSGAYAWDDDRRERFANDIDVEWALIAVSAASNRSKSDKDPADWVPPDPDDLCPFLSAWIAVKVRWQLAVDDRERTALSSLANQCPADRMPVVLAP